MTTFDAVPAKCSDCNWAGLLSAVEDGECPECGEKVVGLELAQGAPPSIPAAKQTRPSQSPIRPASLWHGHRVRHFISGSIVFLLGVAANETINLYRSQSAKKVRWQSSEIQNYRALKRLPDATNAIEIGFADDGAIIWRVKK